jgi:hypothetical protein
LGLLAAPKHIKAALTEGWANKEKNSSEGDEK